jgi:hypothetical protein
MRFYNIICECASDLSGKYCSHRVVTFVPCFRAENLATLFVHNKRAVRMCNNWSNVGAQNLVWSVTTWLADPLHELWASHCYGEHLQVNRCGQWQDDSGCSLKLGWHAAWDILTPTFINLHITTLFDTPVVMWTLALTVEIVTWLPTISCYSEIHHTCMKQFHSVCNIHVRRLKRLATVSL